MHRAYPEGFTEWQEKLPNAPRQKIDALLASNIWVRDCVIRLFENVEQARLVPILDVNHREKPAIIIASMVYNCIQSKYFMPSAGFMLKAWHDSGHTELVADVLSELPKAEYRDLMNNYIHLPV